MYLMNIKKNFAGRGGNRSFAVGAAVFALIASALTAGGGDLVDDLWFFADYDTPARIDGRYLDLAADPVCLRDGRYGRGYYFHRGVHNRLPPMAEFLGSPTNYTVSGGAKCEYDSAARRLKMSAAGEITFRPVADPLGYSWVRPAGAATCSFYVKGVAGTVVTLTPSISPVTEEGLKAAVKKHKLDPAKQEPDSVVASTNTMNGGWQRVYAAVRHDVRTTAGRRITLSVKSTGPVEMERFQYEQTSTFPFIGNVKPALWVEGGVKLASGEKIISDPELVKNFPADRGTASFWVRSVDGDWVWGSCRAWAYRESPNCEFSFDGDFRPGSWGSRFMLPATNQVKRSEKWQHVAMTWAVSNYNVYVDGRLVYHTGRGAVVGERGGRRELRIGTATNGSQPGDMIMDEIAIFRRDLSAGEIAALAARETGLAAGRRQLLAAPVDFPFYWRNQTDAALRTVVSSTAAGEWRLGGEVGGKPLAGRTVKIKVGENRLAVPFDPGRFRTGRYPWRFKLTGADGADDLVCEGMLEIRGRFERGAPTCLSWGGNRPISNWFLKLTGLSACNVGSGNVPAVRSLVADGIIPNLRHENAGSWKCHDFDYAAVERETERALSRYEGLFVWSSTLVNSEVYGTWRAATAAKSPKFLAAAEKAIGMKPDFTFGNAPSQVDWKALGMAKPLGVIGPTNATVETLKWYIRRGDPVYGVNAANRRAIHRLSPGNVVWSEPLYGGVAADVDMVADWFYSYSVTDNMMGMRRCDGSLRGLDKPFMATLSMYTDAPGFNFNRPGKDGRPERVSMGQGYDELAIKTHLAVAAIRCDRLSMFSADSWQSGLAGYAAWRAAPTNHVGAICDPDAPARYGVLVRERVMPELELMRGMNNVRAPVAILEPSEPDIAGGHWWIHWHFVRAMRRAVMSQPVPCDVVRGGEMADADILAKYRYLVFPMSSVVAESHFKALTEASKRGSTVVIDSYAVNTYPGCIKVGSRYRNHPGMLGKYAGEPLLAWYTNCIDELRGRLTALSDRDLGQQSFTCEKVYDGVRYVTVVNNRRREHSEGGGVLTEFCTNSWYRPYGAPQRIVTTVRGTRRGSAVYEFNAPDGGCGRRETAAGDAPGEMRIAADYAPAEAKVFVIHPEPVAGPELSVKIKDPGRAVISVRIVTASGRPAPGRTVVKLAVTDPDGRVTDESGRYPVENGAAEIPLRFADCDPEGGLFSKWKAVVTDLTTGAKASVHFRPER